MRFACWITSVLAIVIGVGLLAGPRAAVAEERIVQDLELDALKEAVRWPHADVAAVMTLASRLIAGRRDADGLVYFRERAASEPGRGLFHALEGVFPARQADTISLFRRVGWVNEAVAKLDRGVALEPGLPRYLRGIVLAGLPDRFGKAQSAVEDLTWMLDNKERLAGSGSHHAPTVSSTEAGICHRRCPTLRRIAPPRHAAVASAPVRPGSEFGPSPHDDGSPRKRAGQHGH